MPSPQTRSQAAPLLTQLFQLHPTPSGTAADQELPAANRILSKWDLLANHTVGAKHLLRLSAARLPARSPHMLYRSTWLSMMVHTALWHLHTSLGTCHCCCHANQHKPAVVHKTRFKLYPLPLSCPKHDTSLIDSSPAKTVRCVPQQQHVTAVTIYINLHKLNDTLPLSKQKQLEHLTCP